MLDTCTYAEVYSVLSGRVLDTFTCLSILHMECSIFSSAIMVPVPGERARQEHLP